MTAFRALTRAQWYGFWREKQNLFWIIGFPLMFLLLFGLLFRDVGASKSDLVQIGPVSVIDDMPADARAGLNEVFTITRLDDEAAARDRVRRGDADAAIQMTGNTVLLHYTQADQVRAGILEGTVRSVVQGANLAVSGTPPRFDLQARPVENERLTVIQAMTPGLLGWAVAMGAVFNAAMPLVGWRVNKLLRRLRLAPIHTETLVASRTVVSVTVALIQTALFLGAGMLIFGLRLRGSWYMVVPLVLCATLAFMAIGLVAGAVSKTSEGASGLANLIVLPMAFLSGSFVQLDAAPQWLLAVAKVLPLGHFNEGLKNVLVRGQGPETTLVPMLILLGFALVFGLLAARLFRWED